MAYLSSSWRAATSPVEAFRLVFGKTVDEATALRELRRAFGAKAPVLIQQNGDMAAEYERLFGVRPHHRMKPETIRRKVLEHGDAR